MVWEQRLEAFRNAVLRASERNPQIVFAIRGMHPSYVEWSTNHAVVGDVQAQFFLRMLNRILEPVKNKVSFRNIIIIFTQPPLTLLDDAGHNTSPALTTSANICHLWTRWYWRKAAWKLNLSPQVNRRMQCCISNQGLQKHHCWNSKAELQMLQFTIHNNARSCSILRMWRGFKVLALLKTGEEPTYSESYRPISLHCILYKL